MPKQKDRHLEAPVEANRDKHINFLAEEMGDADPASENFDDIAAPDPDAGVDNGFFTTDDKTLQNKNDKKNLDRNEKSTPLDVDETKTSAGSADKQSTAYNNEDDQAH